MRTVMAFGTFDFLHPGHLFYLKKARALGDWLIVVVARDCNVKALKGKKPLNAEKDRLKLIKELSFVDEAVLGDAKLREWAVVKRFRPVAIALGYDQWACIPSLRKELKKEGVYPQIVRIKAFKPKTNKSSQIRRQQPSSF